MTMLRVLRSCLMLAVLDLLHPNEAGYSVWAEALRPVLPQ